MTKFTLKKAAIVALLVTPMVLTSCGKEDNSKQAKKATTTVSTSAVATSTSVETSTEETTTETSTPEETTTATSAEETTSSQAPLTTSVEETTSLAPVTTSSAAAKTTSVAKQADAAAALKGKPATAAEKAEFTKVVQGVLPTADTKATMIGVLTYTCNSMLKEQLGQQFDRKQMITALQQLPPELMQQAMAQLRQQNISIPTDSVQLNPITEAAINGNDASAKVSYKLKNGNVESGIQHFVKEDGQWRVCR